MPKNFLFFSFPFSLRVLPFFIFCEIFFFLQLKLFVSDLISPSTCSRRVQPYGCNTEIRALIFFWPSEITPKKKLLCM